MNLTEIFIKKRSRLYDDPRIGDKVTILPYVSVKEAGEYAIKEELLSVPDWDVFKKRIYKVAAEIDHTKSIFLEKEPYIWPSRWFMVVQKKRRRPLMNLCYRHFGLINKKTGLPDFYFYIGQKVLLKDEEVGLIKKRPSSENITEKLDEVLKIYDIFESPNGYQEIRIRDKSFIIDTHQAALRPVTRQESIQKRRLHP